MHAVVVFDQSCQSRLPATPVVFVHVCVPPLGSVPVQSMLTLEPLELEAPEVDDPEPAADEDELELPPVEPWLEPEVEAELEPEPLELAPEWLPEVDPELPCELAPELPPELVEVVPADPGLPCEPAPEVPPELDPWVALEVVPEPAPAVSLPEPVSVVDGPHASASATRAGRMVPRRIRIKDLPGRETGGAKHRTLARPKVRSIGETRWRHRSAQLQDCSGLGAPVLQPFGRTPRGPWSPTPCT